MDSLNLGNLQIENKLKVIFNEIQKKILKEDEDIIDELDPLILELNQEDKEICLKFMNENFINYPFLETGGYLTDVSFIHSVQQNQLTILEQYREACQKKSLIILQKLLNSEESLDIFKIPKFISKEILFQLIDTVQENIFEILDLIQIFMNSDDINYPIKIIKLLSIIYNNEYTIEIKSQITFIISQLLIPSQLLYRSYIKLLHQQDESLFLNLQNQMQQIQTQQVQKNQLFTQSEYLNYQFYIEICTLDLQQNKKELDIFIENILRIPNNKFNLNTMKKGIEKMQFSSSNYYLENLYFRIMFYFFIEYCIKFKLQAQFVKLQQDIQEVEIDRRPQVFLRFYRKNIKEDDQIYKFVLQAVFGFYQVSEQLEFGSIDKNIQNHINNLDLQNLTVEQLIINLNENQHFFLNSLKNLPIIYIQICLKQNPLIQIILYLYFQKYINQNILKLFQRVLQKQFNQNEDIFQNLFSNSIQNNCSELFYVIEAICPLLNITNDELYFYKRAILFSLKLNKFDRIVKIKNMFEIDYQTQSIQERINLVNNIKSDDWIIMNQIFNTQKIETFAINLIKKNFIYYNFFHRMFSNIKLQNCYLIAIKKWSSRIGFNRLIYLILQNNNHQITSKIFQVTILLLIYSIKSVSTHEKKLKIIQQFQVLFNEQNHYLLEHIEKFLTYERPYLLYIGMLLLHQHCFYQNNDQIENQCLKIFDFDRSFYIKFFQQNKYFKKFHLTPNQILKNRLYSLIPYEAESISLEDFNISLVQFTESESRDIIKQWLNNSNDIELFKMIIPFLFNILKRGESEKTLLSQMNNELNQVEQLNLLLQSINMKSLFQIFYNNSTSELQLMLLKLYSKNSPVPFVYQQPNQHQISKELNSYILNKNLFYIFPTCYSIINLSLSKIQSSYGKTSLINKIFYQEEKFQISDKCKINDNSIDIMLDMCFSNTRDFAIADCHGNLPLELIRLILPFFQLIILQCNGENEIEENLEQLQLLNQNCQYNNQNICFIIRNSNTNLVLENQNIISKVNQQGIEIIQIIDLNQSGLDQQKLNYEYERVSQFIFTKIINNQNTYQLKTDQSQYLTMLEKCLYFQSYNLEDIYESKQLIQNIQEQLDFMLSEQHQFYSKKAFPIRSIEKQMKNLKIQRQELSKQPETNQLKIDEINNQLTTLNKEIGQQNPSTLILQFQQIFKLSNYYITYIWFVETLRIFNKNNINQLEEESQNLNKKLQELKEFKKNKKKQTVSEIYNNTTKSDINNLKKMIDIKLQQIEQTNVGLEQFWREIIQLALRAQQFNNAFDPVSIVHKLIKKGECFEFLDGENNRIEKQFLVQLMDAFGDQANQHVLVFSILGPQSSGKSTLLNQIFGSHFLASVGRCTQGIYLQLIKISNKKIFNDLFDYILILDSEGLQNPNQKDQDFDKKMALFVLAMSDIVLINVKGDINQQFKELVEMCIYTFGKMQNDLSMNKQLSWCFNQNNDVSNYAPFLQQIQSIANNLTREFSNNENDDSNDGINYVEILNICKDNILILGFATTEKKWEESKLKLSQNWRELQYLKSFSKEAYNYMFQIVHSFTRKLTQQSSAKQLNSLILFVEKVDKLWQTICALPDLLEFTQLIQLQQDQLLKIECEKIFDNCNFSFVDNLQQLIEGDVKNLLEKNIETLNQLQQKWELDTNKKIEQEKLKAQEKLKIEREQNQIQKKIFVKYQVVLDNKIDAKASDIQLSIIDQINNFKAELQKSIGFIKLDKLIEQISVQKEFLQKMKDNNILRFETFENIWKDIVSQQMEQQKKGFKEFANKMFSVIEQLFSNIAIDDTYTTHLQQQISNQFYSQNPKNQQDLIKKFFVDQLQSTSYFTYVSVRYQDIFQQDLTKKIEKQTNNHIIEFKNYITLQVTYIAIKKQDLNFYFQNNFLDDFIDFLKENEVYIWMLFFEILTQFKIKFDKQLLEILKETIYDIQIKLKSKKKCAQYIGKEFKNFWNDSEAETAFKNFAMSIKVDEAQNEVIIINEKDFVQNFKRYKKLQFFHQTVTRSQLDNNYAITQFQQKQGSNFILLYLNTKYIPVKKADYYFQYIVQDSGAADQNWFLQNASKEFNHLMCNTDGWIKIYNKIFEIENFYYLKDKPIKNLFHFILILQQEIHISTNISSLVKLIIGKVEQQIIEYNKQFALFGVILSTIGERWIYRIVLLLIWKLQCQKKYAQLQSYQQQLEEMKAIEFQKFVANILQNKREQSIISAQTLAQLINSSYYLQFQADKKQDMLNFIKQYQFKSQQLIEQLDNQILEEYQPDMNKDQETLEYITDQTKYIDKYVKNQIIFIKEQFHKKYQLMFNNYISDRLNRVAENAQTLQNMLAGSLKSLLYFSNTQENINYDQLLYQIVLQCIQGKSHGKENLIAQNEREKFNYTNYKQIEIPFGQIISRQGDEQIQLLQPFIEELVKQLKYYQQNQPERKINDETLNLKSEFDQIRLMQTGCQHQCPMCNRKCNQQLEDKHIHQCQHQLRGMNGVMINNTPSLFSCEEIKDDSIIITSETNKQQQWKEIKKIYNDWQFKDPNLLNVQLEKRKTLMMNIWNEGIGQMISKYFREKLKQEVIYKIKHEFQELLEEKVHFIFMLDDSGSMYGDRWENVKCGSLQCMKDISERQSSKISVIIFNRSARLAVNCEQINIEKIAMSLKFQGGGTNFNEAFKLAYKQIVIPQDFDRITLLFYTDGCDSYPTEAMKLFESLSSITKQKINFTACTEESNAQTLKKLAEQFKEKMQSGELKQSIKTNAVQKVWKEVIYQNYHQLKIQ